jgi:hypothetical protein
LLMKRQYPQVVESAMEILPIDGCGTGHWEAGDTKLLGRRENQGLGPRQGNSRLGWALVR